MVENIPVRKYTVKYPGIKGRNVGNTLHWFGKNIHVHRVCTYVMKQME